MTPAETAAHIAALARLLQGTGIATLELQAPDFTVRLHRATGTAPPQAAAPDSYATAAAPGIFRHAHPAQPQPLVQPGQAVAAGAPLGLLQVGALLIHVPAPQDGTVLAVEAPDGAPVGFGTKLVRLAARGRT